MAVPVSYAGVLLPFPPAEMVAWVQGNIDYSWLCEFWERGWPGPGLAALPWRGVKNPSGPVVLNRLVWPRGASRFAVAHFVVTLQQLNQIRAAVQQSSTLASANLTLGPYLSIPMFMLPPRPISYQTFNYSYLLTLVDDRFYWWMRGANIVVNEGSTSWAGLYNQIISGIATVGSFSGDAVDAAYLVPTADLSASYQPLPILLDAAALSAGQRIVRDFDGTVRAMSAATCNTYFGANVINQSKPAPAAADVAKGLSTSLANMSNVKAGGALNFDATVADDYACILPASVTVAFRKEIDGVLQTDRYAIQVPFSSLALPDIKGQYTKTLNNSTTKVFRDACIAYFSSGNTVPNDQAQLQALANQIATDFYRFRVGGRVCINLMDFRYWLPEGYSDEIIFDWGGCTRIESGAWFDHAEELFHFIGAPASSSSTSHPSQSQSQSQSQTSVTSASSSAASLGSASSSSFACPAGCIDVGPLFGGCCQFIPDHITVSFPGGAQYCIPWDSELREYFAVINYLGTNLDVALSCNGGNWYLFVNNQIYTSNVSTTPINASYTTYFGTVTVSSIACQPCGSSSSGSFSPCPDPVCIDIGGGCMVSSVLNLTLSNFGNGVRPICGPCDPGVDTIQACAVYQGTGLWIAVIQFANCQPGVVRVQYTIDGTVTVLIDFGTGTFGSVTLALNPCDCLPNGKFRGIHGAFSGVGIYCPNRFPGDLSGSCDVQVDSAIDCDCVASSSSSMKSSSSSSTAGGDITTLCCNAVKRHLTATFLFSFMDCACYNSATTSILTYGGTDGSGYPFWTGSIDVGCGTFVLTLTCMPDGMGAGVWFMNIDGCGAGSSGLMATNSCTPLILTYTGSPSNCTFNKSICADGSLVFSLQVSD